MTDLKTANEQLTEAIAALESNEHEADVREAEALRLRLMELDAKTGARITAKLEAHKAIALAWKEDGAVTASDNYRDWLAQQKTRLYVQDTSASTLTIGHGIQAPLEPGLTTVTKVESGSTDGLTADAWEKHREEHTGKYALSGEEIPDPVLVNGVAEMQQAETVTES